MDRLRTIAQARLRAKTIEIITFPKLGRPLDGTFLFILRAYRGQMTPFITFNIPKSHPECLVYKYIGSLPCLADPGCPLFDDPQGLFLLPGPALHFMTAQRQKKSASNGEDLALAVTL